MKSIDLSHLNNDFWIGYFMGALVWIGGFLISIQHFIYLTLTLVVIDLITGVIAAWKRQDKIISRRMQRTIEKFVLYFLAIISAHAVKVVLMESAPVTYVVVSSIVLVEFKSIIENVESVTDVDVWAKLKSIINSFQKNKK